MRYRYLDDLQRGISVFAIFSHGIAVLGIPQCPPPDDSTFYLIRRHRLLHIVNGPPLYIQFCFKGNVICKGSDVVDTHYLILVYHISDSGCLI